MRTHVIVGAGAVGTILACRLAGAGEPLLLVESDRRRRRQLREGPLRLDDEPPLPAPEVLGEVEALADRELGAVMICTKTWALRELLPRLARLLPEGTLVVSFQNGIGPEAELRRLLPAARVARAVINFAGNLEPGTGRALLRWSQPPNQLGPVDEADAPALVELCALLGRAGLPTELISASELLRQVFYKTVLSCALNALCATSNLTMRQAMAAPHTRGLALTLVSEGLAVAAAAGHDFGPDGRQRCLEYLERGGDHLPSMWTDLQRGLPTEIEHINGKIVEIGLRLGGLEVGANLFFTSMVIAREIRSGARGPDDVPDYLRRA
jgi:2-dehydropantoate 2-reductase